jgi:hypothetical protein
MKLEVLRILTITVALAGLCIFFKGQYNLSLGNSITLFTGLWGILIAFSNQIAFLMWEVEMLNSQMTYVRRLPYNIGSNE